MSDRIIATTAPDGSLGLIGPEVIEDRQGRTTTYRWRGSKDDCVTKREQQRHLALWSTISLTPESDGNIWNLSMSRSGLPDEDGGQDADVPQNTHELEVSIENVPIYQNLVLHVRLGASSNALVGAIQRIAKKYEAGFFEPDTDDTGTALDNAEIALAVEIGKIDGSKTAACNKILELIVCRGVTESLIFKETYRRTITAASFAQVQAAYTGCGLIWTPDEVTAFEEVPVGEWFGLDPDSQFLKAKPNVLASSNGKTQIIYYYQGGFQFASYWLYEAYGAATLDGGP